MKFQVPVQSDPDKFGKRSIPVLAGRYHFRVEKFEAFSAQMNGSHLLYLEIVWADRDHQDEIGKVHRERLWSEGRKPEETEWAERLHNLALAAGLVTKEQLKQHRQDGTAPEYDLVVDLPGRHLLGELEERGDNQGNKYVNIAGRGFCLFHPNDPASKDFPCLEELLKREGVERNLKSPAERDMAGLM